MSEDIEKSASELYHEGDQIPMPRFRSHKVVQALEVVARRVPTPEPGTCIELVPVDTRFEPFQPDPQWIQKHSPSGRGYYVVYPDGYVSWSPAGAFESGYTPLDGPPFPSQAQADDSPEPEQGTNADPQ